MVGGKFDRTTVTKDPLGTKLSIQIHTTEETTISRMNQDFEKVKASDLQQIKNLHNNLDILL
jgi:hypothetical protein